MAKKSFLATLFGALLSTAAFCTDLPPDYIITGGATDAGLPSFYVTKSDVQFPTYTSIQTAINAIITDAIQSNPGPQPVPAPFGTIVIRFGDGTNELYIKRHI